MPGTGGALVVVDLRVVAGSLAEGEGLASFIYDLRIMIDDS
jgi:hypothetical protein